MEESLLTNSNNKYKISNNQLDSHQNSYYDKSKFQNNYSNYYQSNGQDGYYIQSLRSQNAVDRNEMQFLLMLNQLIIIITMLYNILLIYSSSNYIYFYIPLLTFIIVQFMGLYAYQYKKMMYLQIFVWIFSAIVLYNSILFLLYIIKHTGKFDSLTEQEIRLYYNSAVPITSGYFLQIFSYLVSQYLYNQIKIYFSQFKEDSGYLLYQTVSSQNMSQLNFVNPQSYTETKKSNSSQKQSQLNKIQIKQSQNQHQFKIIKQEKNGRNNLQISKNQNIRPLSFLKTQNQSKSNKQPIQLSKSQQIIYKKSSSQQLNLKLKENDENNKQNSFKKQLQQQQKQQTLCIPNNDENVQNRKKQFSHSAENQFDYDQFSKITEIQNDNEKEENLTDQDIKYQQYEQKCINEQISQKQDKNSEKEVEQNQGLI